MLRIADAYFSYGQYAQAAELYRAALQKGADANLANTRLGAALALAGQRAEAEAAFRAVTGPRAELAQFWLLWLSQPRLTKGTVAATVPYSCHVRRPDLRRAE